MMIDSDAAEAIIAELPRLKAQITAERAKGSSSVPNLAHRVNVLTQQLRAYREALANPTPNPTPKLEVIPKRKIKGHARFTKDCDRGSSCSICLAMGGRDEYSLNPAFFE